MWLYHSLLDIKRLGRKPASNGITIDGRTALKRFATSLVGNFASVLTSAKGRQLKSRSGSPFLKSKANPVIDHEWGKVPEKASHRTLRSNFLTWGQWVTRYLYITILIQKPHFQLLHLMQTSQRPYDTHLETILALLRVLVLPLLKTRHSSQHLENMVRLVFGFSHREDLEATIVSPAKLYAALSAQRSDAIGAVPAQQGSVTN